MISLIVLVLLAAGAAVMYRKGTLVWAVTMIFNAILAGFVALAFYEMLAVYLVRYMESLAIWAPFISYVLLFIVAFALLQTVAMQVGKEKIDMGVWPERVGRAVGGLLLAYLVVGQLLVAGALAPLPSAYPYPRFDERNPNALQPSRPLLSPDGFVSGLFSLVSQGSLSALSQPHSFAMVHAGYVDSLYLNRLKPAGDVPLATKEPALEIKKGNVWDAPPTLRAAEGRTPTTTPNARLMVVRVGVKKQAIADAGKFTLSQWRLVCGPRGAANPLAGKGYAAYPLGYVGSDGRLVAKPLDEVATIAQNDFRGNSRSFDLVFAVPMDMIPILIGFKQNNLEQLSAPVSADEAPSATSAEEPPQTVVPGSPQTPAQPAPQTPSPSRGRPPRGPSSQGSGLSPAGQMATGGALEPGMNP